MSVTNRNSAALVIHGSSRNNVRRHRVSTLYISMYLYTVHDLWYNPQTTTSFVVYDGISILEREREKQGWYSSGSRPDGAFHDRSTAKGFLIPGVNISRTPPGSYDYVQSWEGARVCVHIVYWIRKRDVGITLYCCLTTVDTRCPMYTTKAQ